MTTVLVIIGLTCNTLGCYWAKDSRFPKPFATQEQCAQAAASAPQSFAFFQLSCMIESGK